MKHVKRILIFCVLAAQLFAEIRLKDICHVENTSQESLIGYGLVIGLGGTGDRATGSRGAVFTVQTISNMLERFGITIPKEQLRTRNVAAVMVTGDTPLFGRVGTHFDVTVSSIGDATSLEGGVLLMTPLLGGDGTPWAMAQGAVSIGGYNIETDAGERLRKNHALVGRVPSGAQLKKAVDDGGFNVNDPLRLLLNTPDFSTATRIATAINSVWGPENFPGADSEPFELIVTTVVDSLGDTTVVVDSSANVSTAVSKIKNLAIPLNSAVIEVVFPEYVTSLGDASFFIASIETLKVTTDVEARVVINERTGTVVAGRNVVIDEVMISHGNLTVHTKRTPIISQPSAAFSNVGQTVVEQITNTTAEEEFAKTGVISQTTTVSDLAIALNEMGLKPRDIIAIFQAVKQAGALNAKLIIM